MPQPSKWTVAAFSLAFALAGCSRRPKPAPVASPQPVRVKQAPPTPIETKRRELGGPAWNPGWDTLIERSLPAAMLSRRVPPDVRRFCPRFYRMSATDKREYWAYFFQALAGAEAGLNARSNVLHADADMGTDRVTRLPIRSEGLMQVTYEDAKRYGCNFHWNVDRRLPLHDPRRTILDPKNNLACGIKILERQILAERKPLFTASSYWATLRPGNAGFRVFAKQMTDPPKACGAIQRPALRRSVPASGASVPRRAPGDNSTVP